MSAASDITEAERQEFDELIRSTMQLPIRARLKATVKLGQQLACAPRPQLLHHVLLLEPWHAILYPAHSCLLEALGDDLDRGVPAERWEGEIVWFKGMQLQREWAAAMSRGERVLAELLAATPRTLLQLETQYRIGHVFMEMSPPAAIRIWADLLVNSHDRIQQSQWLWELAVVMAAGHRKLYLSWLNHYWSSTQLNLTGRLRFRLLFAASQVSRNQLTSAMSLLQQCEVEIKLAPQAVMMKEIADIKPLVGDMELLNEAIWNPRINNDRWLSPSVYGLVRIPNREEPVI